MRYAVALLLACLAASASGMTPVYQRTDCDCFPACVASITERPLASLPCIDYRDPFWQAKTWDAYAEQGLAFDRVCELNPEQFYIACIAYQYGDGGTHGHAVVTKGRRIVHDPSPRPPSPRRMVAWYYLAVRALEGNP